MKNKNGSCLLILSLMSSIILIYSLNSLQSTIYNKELIHKQYLYEYNFRILESLHNFGIFQTINNNRKIYKIKNPNNRTMQVTKLYNGPWPLKSGSESNKIPNLISSYSGLITISIKDDIAIVNSKLINLKTKETYLMESKIKKIKEVDPNNKASIRFLLYDYKF